MPSDAARGETSPNEVVPASGRAMVEDDGTPSPRIQKDVTERGGWKGG